MPPEVFAEVFRTRYIWERDEFINGERQFYVDPTNPEHNFNPFGLDDTGLTITGRKRNIANESFTSQEYLSGVISTHQRPGIIPETSRGPRRLSALLAMPVGGGVWPAWWFNPENAAELYEGDPNDPNDDGVDILPEIDGMEYKGEGGRYYSTVHSRDNPDQVLNEDQYTHNCPDLSLMDHHWYHMERDEQFLKFGFGNNWVKRALTPADLQGPLHWNLNLAIGGTWPESCSGRPVLQSYMFRCMKIVMSVPPSEGTVITVPGDVTPTPIEGNPNRDIINRLEKIKADQEIKCEQVINPITQWIAELSR